MKGVRTNGPSPVSRTKYSFGEGPLACSGLPRTRKTHIGQRTQRRASEFAAMLCGHPISKRLCDKARLSRGPVRDTRTASIASGILAGGDKGGTD